MGELRYMYFALGSVRLMKLRGMLGVLDMQYAWQGACGMSVGKPEEVGRWSWKLLWKYSAKG